MIPHDPKAEAAALGAVLAAGASGSQAEVDALLDQLRPGLFHVEGHRQILESMKVLRGSSHAVDTITVFSSLASRNGHGHMGKDLLPTLPDVSWATFPSYLEILQDHAMRRYLLGLREDLSAMASDPSLTLDRLKERISDISDKSLKIGKPKREPLEIVSVSQHLRYNPPESLCLVGDTDFSKGYSGVTVMAGPPGSGKSLAVVALAVAGAKGHGTWMGRTVHRRFKTLIIQAENGARRLQREFQEMKNQHPEVDFDSWVRVSLPPEGGLPFHRPEFRRALGKVIQDWMPDLVVIDPWTAVAVDDGSKDIIDKLAEIRSVMPPGDQCPGLVVVAHTKKPRPEDKGNRGRSLMFSVSGSQALVATARAVFVLLPFTDDITDNRVMLCCAKLSDSDSPPRDSVWFRRMGTLFDPCPDSPEDYWDEDSKAERQWLTLDMVRDELDGNTMTQPRLVERLTEKYNQGAGAATVYRWLKRPPFEAHLKKDGKLLSWTE